ncbi:MAG: tetratricopeptide repeat protein [Planctomycetia bacterium]
MRVLCAIIVAATSAAGVVSACLWDHDTEQMEKIVYPEGLNEERSKFPGALELMTGKFLRHSKEFYQWRVDDRLKRLAAGEDTPNLYDDLAVAYHKTGRSEKAYEVMFEKDRKWPGLYETEANLSVFYTLDGDLVNGLKHVDKALAVNPRASKVQNPLIWSVWVA